MQQCGKREASRNKFLLPQRREGTKNLSVFVPSWQKSLIIKLE